MRHRDVVIVAPFDPLFRRLLHTFVCAIFDCSVPPEESVSDLPIFFCNFDVLCKLANFRPRYHEILTSWSWMMTDLNREFHTLPKWIYLQGYNSTIIYEPLPHLHKNVKTHSSQLSVYTQPTVAPWRSWLTSLGYWVYWVDHGELLRKNHKE